VRLGHTLVLLGGSPNGVRDVAWSLDGRRLYAVTGDEVRAFDVAP
jgi:hypothetical protein